MDQVFDEIDGLMDDRIMQKKTDGMGLGFQGSQDDKDFTVNEAKPKQLPPDPEGIEAIEFSENDMELYASQDLEAEIETPVVEEPAPVPEEPAAGGY